MSSLKKTVNFIYHISSFPTFMFLFFSYFKRLFYNENMKLAPFGMNT